MLIDCGVSFKSIRHIYKDFKIVLLTHIHNDHFNKSTIKTLARERPTLRFACCDWLIQRLVACGVDKKNIDVLEIGKIHDYSLFKVSPIKLYHNVPNCGYRLFFETEKLFYATDTNTLEGISAKDYDLHMVEANYIDEEMAGRIAEKLANDEYPYEYEVIKNHLSKSKCDNFIYSNIGAKGQYVYLHGHQDKE